MKFISNFLLILAASVALFFSARALAWDGAVVGPILSTESWAQGGYDFIASQGGGGHCGSGSSSFTYINQVDPNYKTVVAALLAARVTGATVTVFSTESVYRTPCQS